MPGFTIVAQAGSQKPRRDKEDLDVVAAEQTSPVSSHHIQPGFCSPVSSVSEKARFAKAKGLMLTYLYERKYVAGSGLGQPAGGVS
jgi:hypothetical protein